MNKVFLFCGVESTGKSTSINIIKQRLKHLGFNVCVISEVGRDICAESGGVFEMSIFDYEQILYQHQANFINEYKKTNDTIILLDTDSIYTKYYLEKDTNLQSSNKTQCTQLGILADYIATENIKNGRITDIFYLNSDCEFVQDGTRTYQSTRLQDDKILLNMYKQIYKNITVITGHDWNFRVKNIEKQIKTHLETN